MLQFIKGLPDDVIGIRATGEVDKKDYEEVLIPRMEELARRQGEISYLLVLETNVQNFSIAAWWQDFRLAIKHFSKWKKVAIVTDQASVEWLIDVAKHFVPGESRGYKLTELNDAIDWVSNEESHEPAEISIDKVKEQNATWSSNKNQGPAGENL
ncbi:MAG: STAS/SEC14 domain-containing protein [Bacteroidetes bacterium]|nr:STAS/SEC14 domain-containing protein [Bacteroidota bacterium]